MTQSAEQVLAQIKQIPTFPDHIVRLVEAIDSAKSSAPEVAALIEQDPGLTTNLLKLANSAFYGFLGRVTTVREAVVLIGLRELKNLVLGTTVFRTFSTPSQTGFDRRELWRHSVVCAFLTKMLAREAFLVDQEGTIMISGLLHDVGKVVVDQYFPSAFIEVLRRVREESVTFSQAEKQAVGYTHYQIGATLLKRWNFPEEIAFPVFYHHAPWLDTRFTASSATVYLANHLAKELGFPAYEGEKFGEMPFLRNEVQRDFFEKLGFPASKGEIDTFLRIADTRLKIEAADLFTVFSLAA